MTTLQTSWQSIAELTGKMLQLASEEQWSSIAELSMQRHRIIVAHFERYPVCPQQAEFYQTNLSRFLKEEEQLKQVVTTARRNVLKNVNTMNIGRKARSAYRGAAKSL